MRDATRGLDDMNNKLYKMMNWSQIEDIIYSECDNPHDLLGPHLRGNQTLVQAYFPGAKAVSIQFDLSSQLESVDMELADDDGFLRLLCRKRSFRIIIIL